MSDAWDFYLVRVEDRLASIFVDLGIRTEAPLASHPIMAYLRVPMLRPGEDGLSSQEEYDDLIALEDGVTAQLVPEGTAIFVARITSGGNRDFYFFAADSVKFENAVEVAMRAYPAYEFRIGTKEDPDWLTYFEFLYPSALDMQCMMNRRVLERLQAQGDKGDKSRKIEHLAYLPDAKTKSDLVAYLQAEGFAIEHAPDEANDEGRFVVTFSRADQPTQIDEVSLPLFSKVSELGGEYDGWNCEVIGRKNFFSKLRIPFIRTAGSERHAR